MAELAEVLTNPEVSGALESLRHPAPTGAKFKGRFPAEIIWQVDLFVAHPPIRALPQRRMLLTSK